MHGVTRIARAERASRPSAGEASPPRYWAYFSYSHRDEADAKWLHAALEQYRVPRALVGRPGPHGPTPPCFAPIFRDRQEFAASDNLEGRIGEAIEQSRFLIVLCSPAAAASRWTNQEIITFKRLHPGGTILAAIVAGEPFASAIPGREDEECFPPALRVQFDKRGRATSRRAEPLAADLRPGRDGRKLGLLKIVAGMLGLGLDDLVQREARRRQRKLTLLVAASLGGMAVTSGLALTAVMARDEAREQRREAEGLVGFMLGDLRTKLEPLGRLDALDSVGARALAYFEKQDKEDLSDAALTQRSRALTLLGEIASARGDLDGALRRYREATTGSAEALRRAPDDPQRVFDHAQNVFWVGEIARQRGQTSRAEASMREYKRLSERLIAIDPSEAKWQMEGIYADANLGIVLLDLRRYPEAAAVFQASLGGIEKLAAAAPRDARYRESLIETLAWLADAREREGRLDDALAQRERQLALLAPLISMSRSDAENKRQFMVAHRAAGRLFAMRGELGGAFDHLGTAVQLGAELMHTEPDNADWAGQAAATYLDLGELQLAGGRTEQAGVSARVGCDIGNRLMMKDSSVKLWRMDLRAACLRVRARLALARGNPEEAQDLAGRLVVLARSETGRERSIDSLLNLSLAESLRAIVLRSRGDKIGSERAFGAALAAWPKGLSLEPNLAARHAILLDGLGRRAEADTVAEKLEAMGFRHPTYLRDRQLMKLD